MTVRIKIYIIIVLVLSLAVMDQALAKRRASKAPVKRPSIETLATASGPVWIVVNLFTGASSRQAVRVRDTLARLGAEGKGIVLPYKEITVENMAKLQPEFLALSPNGMPWCHYKGKDGEDLENFLKALKSIVENMNIPVIGICGGHQALALAFGGKVGPIRGGEDDCLPYLPKRKPPEKGRHDIRVLQKDPLFVGMGPTLNLVQNHYDEVKRPPTGFVTLAANDLCSYQIIKHPSKPAYGVQAHTEYYLPKRPDGGLLLKNFLKIAGIHNRLTRKEPVKAVRDTANSEAKPVAPR